MRAPLGISIVLLLLAVGVRPAAAHSVPIAPSTCAFDPVVLSAPTAGTMAPVDPPAPLDFVNIVYDVSSVLRTGQFLDLGTAPRAFTLGGTPGTLTMPSFFVALLYSSGDVAASDVSLTFGGGAAGAGTSVALTTALAAAPGFLIEGSPMDAVGRFTLVGVASDPALAAAFGADPLVVRIDCTAVPVPDRDQFVPTRATLRSGSLRRGTLRARARFEPGPSLFADFAENPALVRVSAGGATLASLVVAEGLAAKGKRRFVGRSADGRATLRVRRQKPRFDLERYLLDLTVRDAVAPAEAPSADVAFTWDVGGFVARASGTLRANKRRSRWRLR